MKERRSLLNVRTVLSVTTHSYPPQRFGGSESSTHDMCALLLERGVRPVVLAGQERTRDAVDAAFGYEVVRAKDPLGSIARVVEQYAPDVAIVQPGMQLECAQRLIALGVPTLVYVRDVEFGRMSGPLFADPLIGYIANSSFTAGEVRRTFGLDCEVIPPIVRRAPYVTESVRTHIVFVNPVPRKGVETVLALARRLPHYKFLIVECWPLGKLEWARLRMRVMRLGNVTWRATTGDMREVYRCARLLLVPSRWHEGWGRVVTEAQISGIPVIASNIGGLPESVGMGGMLIDPDAGLDEWVKAVDLLWNDTAYASYVAAARTSSERPEIDELQLIDKLLVKLASISTTNPRSA